MTKQPLKLVVDRFLAVYDHASPANRELGSIWYSSAAQAITGANQLTPMEATVTSVLSPRISWEENIALAKWVLEGCLGERPVRSVMFNRLALARRVISEWDDGEGIGKFIVERKAPKTFWFAEALRGTDWAVVIDRHIIDIALDRYQARPDGIKYSEYEFLERCLQVAAERRQIAARTFQSIIWNHWRESKQAGVHHQQQQLGGFE